MTVYFDNSATTKPCKEAVDAANKAITELWGNPSSLHELGSLASSELRKSRKNVCKLLGVPEDNFFFTSSGTTANNTAIFGAYEKLKREGNRIVTTAIEHPSVSEPIKRLESYGVEVIRLMPDKNGKINEDELLESINKNTILVSLMAVNNEVGSILPVNAVRSAVKRAGAPALIHADCVQALSKIPVTPKTVDADMYFPILANESLNRKILLSHIFSVAVRKKICIPAQRLPLQYFLSVQQPSALWT